MASCLSSAACMDRPRPVQQGRLESAHRDTLGAAAVRPLPQVSVRRKLNAMPAVFAGKKVLLIDDSIVRGTTMSQIVEMVRRAGAKKVSRIEWGRGMRS